MKYERPINRFEEISKKYSLTEEWLAEANTWTSDIKNIKNALIRKLARLEDENTMIIARDFYSNLDGQLKGRIEWLTLKLEKYILSLNSIIESKDVSKISEKNTEYDMLKREVEQTRDKYLELREDFSNFIQPKYYSREFPNQPTAA